MPPTRTRDRRGPKGGGSIATGKKPDKTSKLRTDAVLAIKPEYVRLIAQRAKNHEFRKYKLAQVERLWLYQSAPISKITHVVTTTYPKVPGEVQDPSGVGNDDFDASKDGLKYGYPVLHLHRLSEPLSIAIMQKYGLTAPQGVVYVPTKLAEDFPLDQMIRIF